MINTIEILERLWHNTHPLLMTPIVLFVDGEQKMITFKVVEIIKDVEVWLQ